MSPGLSLGMGLGLAARHDVGLPAALSGVSVSGSVGHALVNATPGANTHKIRIWYSADSTLDPATDTPVIDHLVTPGVAVTGKAIGDATRTQLAVDYAFANGLANWPTSGGSLSASPGLISNAGASGLVRQFPLLNPSTSYRWFLRVPTWTAGTARAYLGSTAVFGATIGSAGDSYGAILHDATGADQFGLQMLTGWNATFSLFSLYENSGATLPQGPGYIFAAGVNQVDKLGPISSAIPVIIF